MDFLQQILFEHALNRAVERSRAQAYLPAGSGGDFLNDRVAMPVFIGESQQDVKSGGLEWQEGVGSRIVDRHTSNICDVDILSMHTIGLARSLTSRYILRAVRSR